MAKVIEKVHTHNGTGKASIKAYQIIREEIVTGMFKPRDELKERILSELTGLSRTPIREALYRLNAEGMVTLEANRTAYVADVDRREIEEIFSLACLLGNHAARLAAQGISDAALDDLLKLVEQMEALLTREEDGLFGAFKEIDRSFHLIIRIAAGNHRLIRLERGLLSAPILFQAMARFTRDHYESFVPLYRNIYDALKECSRV